MIHQETPRELYARLEAQVSPLLREMLGSTLPHIDSRDWWNNCVIPSLSPIQLDYLQDTRTLEQFDFPALVSIVLNNWRSLRPLLGVGDELKNYLFTLKTFRNDVQHRPDLILDDERRAHVIQAANLAVKVLTNKPPRQTPHLTVSRRTRVIGIALASLTALVLIGVWAWPGDTDKTVDAKVEAKAQPTAATTVDRLHPTRRAALQKLGNHLSTPTIHLCLRYQRNNGTWSKAYTVRGTIETGETLRVFSGLDTFQPDLHHAVVHWKKSDDYTVIPLRRGARRPSREIEHYYDIEGRAWKMKEGWTNCDHP